MKNESILHTQSSGLVSRTEGRLATLPIRVFGLALYISIFFVELISWNLEWCGSGYGASWLFALLVILGAFVALEWAEQRYLVGKPILMVAIGAIALRILLTEVAGPYSCTGFHTFFAFIPPILAYLYIGQKAALITAAINIGLYIKWIVGDGLITAEYLQDENVPVEFFIVLVGMIVMLVLGRTLVLEERNREQAEQLLAELEQSQKQLTQLAKVEERNRIARDIHDSVGHHLMAVTVQLEKAKAFRAINPQEADQALDDAKRATQFALADVRESVSTLRDSDSPFSLGDALQRLVNGFDRVPTTFTMQGDEAPFAKSTLMALYRAAQEGLTNIEKHAAATEINLRVSLQSDHATMTLQDNGAGFSMAGLETKTNLTNAHFGLLGLRERLELLGGTLTIESQLGEGTTLSVLVPLRGLE